MQPFEKPKADLEQYPTAAHIASRMLMAIESDFGELEDRSVCDLGCGAGVLSIGAAVLGAGSVISVDVDPDALDRLRPRGRTEAGKIGDDCRKALRSGLPFDDVSAWLVDRCRPRDVLGEAFAPLQRDYGLGLDAVDPRVRRKLRDAPEDSVRRVVDDLRRIMRTSRIQNPSQWLSDALDRDKPSPKKEESKSRKRSRSRSRSRDRPKRRHAKEKKEEKEEQKEQTKEKEGKGRNSTRPARPEGRAADIYLRRPWGRVTGAPPLCMELSPCPNEAVHFISVCMHFCITAYMYMHICI